MIERKGNGLPVGIANVVGLEWLCINYNWTELDFFEGLKLDFPHIPECLSPLNSQSNRS